MTNQEIFDTVVRHLWAQGKQSINRNGECVYRGPRRTKCAVGCLIPDDKYKPRMDDRRNVNMALEDVMVIADIPFVHERLLSNLQRAHDNADNWHDAGPNYDMVSVLASIGRAFGLSTAVLVEVFA